MTQTRRIILNVIATYGRSLISLVCGLFTGRWVLEALGSTSYGVFGVVGAIIGLVTVVNQMLATSVSRYFAFAVGQAKSSEDRDTAIKDCQGWFNAALLIHIIIPIVLVLIGYPIGCWAIRNYFDIPLEMIETSVWVFRFALMTTFVGMVAVPFQSLYVANQMIAELTIYSVAQTILNVVFAWILLSYSGDRLWFNAFYMMLIAVLPQMIIMARAFVVFPECRVKFEMMKDRKRYRRLFSFAGWQIFGWIGLTMRFQGLATLCNKALGLQYNSSMTVSNTVSQHAMTFSYALNGAFVPAITNAAGAGDEKLFQSLVLRSCKFGSLLCAIFVIPLAIEIHYVMDLWLVAVPPDAEGLCCITLLTLLVERMGAGLGTAIYAKGNIKMAEILGGLIWACSLPLGCMFVFLCGMGLWGIAWAVFICTILMVVKNAYISWKLADVQIIRWFKSFAFPFILISGLSLVIGGLNVCCFEESFIRLCCSTVLALMVLAVPSFFWMFDEEERRYIIKQTIGRVFNRKEVKYDKN